MRVNRKSLILAIVACLALPALLWAGLYFAGMVPKPGQPLLPPFNLSDRLASLEIVETGDEGELSVVFGAGGEQEVLSLSGDEFLKELNKRQRSDSGQPLLFRLFDITAWTGLLWVLFGLLGQTVFMGRMIIQWLASERVKTSVVPPAFWWMSLLGSSMLMIYFIWRVEIVGLLGQATGWLIYVRNLWFIYGRRSETDSDPNSESAREK